MGHNILDRSTRGTRRRDGAYLATLAVGFAMLASAGVARAETFTVTNLGDTGANGDGSLRGELAAANANPGSDTISFAPGLDGTIPISGSGLVIKDSVDIEGPGPGMVTVQQNSSGHRVVQVKLASPGGVIIAGLHLSGGSSSGRGGDLEYDAEGEAATLTVVDCLITGGSSQDYGGGIASIGAPLTLRASVVSGNKAVSGGGVWAGGENIPFTIEDSMIAGNSASGLGGGLDGEVEAGGHSLIAGTTIAGNESTFGGGGVELSTGVGTTVTVANSTVAGNFTFGPGGGVSIDSTVATTTIEDSTIAGNRALGVYGSNDAGGLDADSAAQTLLDTIVAGNDAGGSGHDIAGKWAGAFSLIGNPSGAELTETVPGSNLLGADPQLGPLAESGGPTETMALAPSSPAVNRGGGSLGSDQRGDVRPVLYPGVPISAAPGANGADIGAYELQAPPSPALPPSAGPLPEVRGAPRVRVSCPKRARPGGCRFALQVVSGKPKRIKGKLHLPQPESALARVKLDPGRSALLTLTPKPRFAARLEAAAKILVREAVTVKGETHTSYRRLGVLG